MCGVAEGQRVTGRPDSIAGIGRRTRDPKHGMMAQKGLDFSNCEHPSAGPAMSIKGEKTRGIY